MRFLIKILAVGILIGFSPLSLSDQATEGRTAPAQESSSNSSAGGSAKQGAKTAMVSQMIGAGVNAAVGAKMMSMCGPQCGTCCAMGAMSLANAASMFANAMASKNTMDSVDFNPGDYGDYTDLNGDGFPDLPGGGGGIDGFPNIPKVTGPGLSNAESLGYSYDPDSGMLTTPDNGTFPADILNDPQAMAAQGFSASDIQMAQGAAVGLNDQYGSALQKNLDKLNRPSVSGVGVGSAGGGGGFGGSGGSDYSFDSKFGNYLGKMNRGLASKKGAVIAGKTKTLGGEKIGVKVDNLFKMVHRRYQAQRKRNNFIESDSGKK